MTNITVLGLGAMGSRMAHNLLRAGYAVTVWNRDPSRADALVAAGAALAPTPAAAVKRADVVLSLLKDDQAARSVWLEQADAAIEGMPATAVAVECSTLSADRSRSQQAALGARGLDYLEAPLVGSRPQAEAAQLIHLVGGDEELLARVEPVLRVSAAAIHHVGPVGAGMAAKLGVNALFAIQVAALGEFLYGLARAGVGAADAVELLAGLPVASPALIGAGRLVAGENYAPLFPIELVLKDLQYFSRLIDDAASTPLTDTARRRYRDAAAAGFGGDNIVAVTRLAGSISGAYPAAGVG